MSALHSAHPHPRSRPPHAICLRIGAVVHWHAAPFGREVESFIRAQPGGASREAIAKEFADQAARLPEVLRMVSVFVSVALPCSSSCA